MDTFTKRAFDLIIFDQDGTLVDSRSDITNSVNHALGVLGLPLLDVTTITGYVGEGITKLIERALGNNKELLDTARTLFLEYYKTHLTENTYLYPNVTEVLEYFKEKHKAVISNKLESLTRDLLRDIGLLHYFDIILGGDSTEKKKPYPDPILKAIESLGVEKKRTLMVGDSPTDIEAGRGAGVFTCAVTYGYRERNTLSSAKPDYIIDNLIELKEIIE